MCGRHKEQLCLNPIQQESLQRKKPVTQKQASEPSRATRATTEATNTGGTHATQAATQAGREHTHTGRAVGRESFVRVCVVYLSRPVRWILNWWPITGDGKGVTRSCTCTWTWTWTGSHSRAGSRVSEMRRDGLGAERDTKGILVVTE